MDHRTVQLGVMASPQVAALVRAAAEKEKRSISNWVLLLIEKELDRQLKESK